MTCVFCEIIAGRSPAEIIYQDDLVLAFRDKHPIAATHILVIPLRHIASVNDLVEEDGGLIGHMVLVAGQLAAQGGVAQAGYRLIMNTGPDGGQTIFHLHLHLVAGRRARYTLG